MPLLTSKTVQDYSIIRSSEDDESVIEDSKLVEKFGNGRTWSTLQVVMLFSLTAFISSLSGYVIGTQRQSWASRSLLSPPGDVIYPMIYNKTFTLAPSPESDAAWDSMFPKGVGFVKHPEISPKASGLAVFHELHCVNILRVGYYAALNGSLEEMQHVHDHNKRPDPHHLRHCFDYLRQSLMCAADTNLEPVDLELGGVTGWRFQRTCRDFEGVKDWAEKNRHWPELG